MGRRRRSATLGGPWQKTRNNQKNTIFVISEGEVTEPTYLSLLMEIKEVFRIRVVISGNRNIRKIKSKIENTKHKHGIYSEIWVAIDKDERTEFQMSEIYKLEKEKGNVKVVASNPCFEIWLLHHYVNAGDVCEGKTVSAAKNTCEERFKKTQGWLNYKRQ